MVRCLGVFLVLVLMLCGCAGEKTELPDNTTKSTISSQSTSSADPNGSGDSMEQVMSDAITNYPLEGTGYYGVLELAHDLLLMRQENGEGILSFYSRDGLKLIKEIRLGQGVLPTLKQILVTQQGISYFDAANKAMVFLNNDHVESGRMHLPEDMVGHACISEDWKMVFYCTEKGIHAMDLQTGISRLLKEQTAFSQEVTGCFGGNGQMLRYEVEVTEGQKQIQLISSDSGMIQYEGAYLTELIGRDQDYYRYFLPRMYRGVRELLFYHDGSGQVLWPLETDAEPYMLFNSEAVVMLQQEENKAALAYYDLTTGKRTAAITLWGFKKIYNVQANPASGVWLLGEDENGEALFYCWDVSKSLTGDENDYTAPYYTLEDPDQEGLVAAAKSADALGKKFGVNVSVWEAAASLAPADHIFTAEHNTKLYDFNLPKLEKLLSALPKELLAQISGEKLQFALVHEIAGEPMWGSLAQSTNLQFWNGEEPVIALVLDENLERNFYHGIYHFMETPILSKSSALYEWNKLNPEGFEYDNNYITNQERIDTSYIEGEMRYFIDLFSMSYAKEDRARIFEFACMPGNEELFKSPVLQTKLQRICEGVRTAFGLTKEESGFLWEQYLNK